MKAIINGITVEGTPYEIAEYQRLINVELPSYKPYVDPLPWWLTQVTCKTGDNVTMIN